MDKSIEDFPEGNAFRFFQELEIEVPNYIYFTFLER